jgi:hypothetical protein
MEDWVFEKFWYGEQIGIENKNDKLMNGKSNKKKF